MCSAGSTGGPRLGKAVHLEKQTKAVAEESGALLNPKTILTPHVCRKGCKHYDPIGDPESGNFREFCGRSKRTLIERDRVCENFESKTRLSEMVLTF